MSAHGDQWASASASSVTIEPITEWISRESRIRSAVLFGSAAGDEKGADAWSDFDLHLVATDVEGLTRVDWGAELPRLEYCLHAVRPATGGVCKATVVFSRGQLDLVIVSALAMKVAAFALQWRPLRRVRPIEIALNEMATCLHSGYRFLKGEREWGGVYARVAALPGVRLADADLRALADSFVCDLLWVLQKLQRGELVAAQHFLHTKLSDTNLRIWREGRRRKGLPLPSFGLGRRVEQLVPAGELEPLLINARLDRVELNAAAWGAFEGLQAVLKDVAVPWVLPPSVRRLLDVYRREG